MLHTKFQGHRHLGSGEEAFFLGFYHIWAWRPFWSCDQERLNKLLLPHPKEAPLWNLASIGPVVSEEKMFENVDIHTYIHTRIHTYTHNTYIHEAFLYYQLTYAPEGLGELKRNFFQRSFFQRKEIIFSEETRISQWWAPLSSMPMMPIYGKNLKKSSSPEPHGCWPWNLVCSIGCSSTTMFIQMITMGWPWPILWHGQIWSLILLYGKRVKQWIFQKQLSSMIWN